MKTRYAIIGAGPTGLGAARRLTELGEKSFVVLEKNSHPGGLAASFTDKKGFTWDIGGHVVFSHYEYYDRLLDELMQGEYIEHLRESWVRALKSWVPYPFQNNIRHLPNQEKWECVRGLLPGERSETTPDNFREWINSIFGKGIAKYFMLPYNYKVWATYPEKMSFSWIGERVSVVDLRSVLKNIILEKDHLSWGPNNKFRFPLKGGTGSIYRKLAATVADHIKYNTQIVSIDQQAKRLTDSEGNMFEYDHLLNTAPIDILTASWLTSPSEQLINAADKLKHNSVIVAGIGLSSSKTDPRCWMYFPENDCPFYRVTNFHNYSPRNTPIPGQGRALMCEVSYSKDKKLDPAKVVQEVEDGLINTTLLSDTERKDIISRWSINVDYGYPIPCLQRDEALQILQPALESMNIYSRGRFGGWKYEVSNMDHSVMQGVEWAQRMINGEPETTYRI
ncbi:protoporphyrinogen/coproporphyrinogen oxidase [Maridesulfovibrio hydrothermalis]|uniref:Amine oxidase, flavin-containing n=1 Tax=Maridesulfovibrio hydrothermalis AM13 = DSM 14728 TaxID=1121451 RepID=L0R994_9BACT|nr:FAD-dependent oxidoreductase [Maridesulfovibrio hydrothermalis]CCO23328.1 Amine oxidase, flavin-containing [Maridesulfovibrio hydrothermalis AM13 = DSM 14728]